MIREGKFGFQEALSILFISMTTKVLFTSPAVIIRMVGTAGWYLTLISALTAGIGLFFLVKLINRFPGSNLMDIYEKVLGKGIGPVFSFFLAGCLFFTASVNLREYTEVMKVYVMPLSPPSYIIILFILVISVMAFMGLESIARFSKFILLIIVCGFIIVICLAYKNYSMGRLFPILGYGLKKTIFTGIGRSSVYGELVLIGVFAASLHGTKHIKKIGFWSLVTSAVFISLNLLFFSLAFPYFSGQEMTSPMYELAALINIGSFFQRMEPIFVFLWNFSSFISVTALFYASMMIYSHIFRIMDRKPLVMPMAIMLFALAMLPEGLSSVMNDSVQFLRTWGWVGYFLPQLLTLLVAVIRKKKEEPTNA